MPIVYLGLGSNLGNREANINAALKKLGAAGITIEKTAAFLETEPVGGPAQGKFINTVAKACTKLSPEEILTQIQTIEKSLGRVRGVKNGPRTIDIDILLYDQLKIKKPNLTIPHPRMKEREFVMTPLNEIAPNMIKKTHIFKKIQSLRNELKKIRLRNQCIGFVPTMGALHQGHLSLIQKSVKENDITVVSIFVNPLQFGPSEDFKNYPRNIKMDQSLAKQAGADIIFIPNEKEMLKSTQLTYVDVEKLTQGLCGAFRPGHFRGVTTIVAKLLNIVQPHSLYLGQKDIQQAVVIQKMTDDLNIPVNIRVCPTVREKDGLAMSSRNQYLSSTQRQEAAILYQALRLGQQLIEAKETVVSKILSRMREKITKSGSVKIQYLACVDPANLEPLKTININALLAGAVWMGNTRLIDNINVHAISRKNK